MNMATQFSGSMAQMARTVEAIKNSKLERQAYELEVQNSKLKLAENERQAAIRERDELANQERISWLGENLGQRDQRPTVDLSKLPQPMAKALGPLFEGMMGNVSGQALARAKAGRWAEIAKGLSPENQERFIKERLVEEQEEQMFAGAKAFGERASKLVMGYQQVPELGDITPILDRIQGMAEAVEANPQSLPQMEKMLGDLTDSLNTQVIDIRKRNTAIGLIDHISGALGPYFTPVLEGAKLALTVGEDPGKAFAPVINAISSSMGVMPDLKIIAQQRGWLTDGQASRDPEFGTLFETTLKAKSEDLAIQEWSKMGAAAQDSEISRAGSRREWIEARSEELRRHVLATEYGMIQGPGPKVGGISPALDYGGAGRSSSKPQAYPTSTKSDGALMSTKDARAVAEELGAKVESGEMTSEQAAQEFFNRTGRDPKEKIQ